MSRRFDREQRGSGPDRFETVQQQTQEQGGRSRNRLLILPGARPEGYLLVGGGVSRLEWRGGGDRPLTGLFTSCRSPPRLEWGWGRKGEEGGWERME